MIWFVLAAVVAVVAAIVTYLDYGDWKDAAATLAAAALVSGVGAVFLNFLFGIANHRFIEQKPCQLEKISSQAYIVSNLDEDEIYYRCVGSDSFLPDAVGDFQSEVRRGETATLVVKKSVKKGNLWSIWKVDGYDQYIFTVPENSIGHDFDK